MRLAEPRNWREKLAARLVGLALRRAARRVAATSQTGATAP
jgi:hypothetical protein